MLVNEFDPGPGNEYNAGSYPHEGVFHIVRTNQIIIVTIQYPGAPLTSGTVWGGPMNTSYAPVFSQRGPNGDMLSVDDLFRAIAVCLHPEAAAKEMDRQERR
jgi:hypothetical protein